MSNLVKAIENQGYEGYYYPQIIPVVGALVSVPVALVSGIKAILKVVQAVFQRAYEGKPFFKPNDGTMKKVNFPMNDALELGKISVNNVFNVLSFSILNCCFVASVYLPKLINKNIND